MIFLCSIRFHFDTEVKQLTRILWKRLKLSNPRANPTNAYLSIFCHLAWQLQIRYIFFTCYKLSNLRLSIWKRSSKNKVWYRIGSKFEKMNFLYNNNYSNDNSNDKDNNNNNNNKAPVLFLDLTLYRWRHHIRSILIHHSSDPSGFPFNTSVSVFFQANDTFE